jgi:hypothetical protein
MGWPALLTAFEYSAQLRASEIGGVDFLGRVREDPGAILGLSGFVLLARHVVVVLHGGQQMAPETEHCKIGLTSCSAGVRALHVCAKSATLLI